MRRSLLRTSRSTLRLSTSTATPLGSSSTISAPWSTTTISIPPPTTCPPLYRGISLLSSATPIPTSSVPRRQTEIVRSPSTTSFSSPIPSTSTSTIGSPIKEVAGRRGTHSAVSFKRLRRLSNPRLNTRQRFEFSSSSFPAISATSSVTAGGGGAHGTGSGTGGGSAGVGPRALAAQLVLKLNGEEDTTNSVDLEKIMEDQVKQIHKKKGFIIDMDGVIYHQSKLIPGAQELVTWLQKTEKEFLFLTNSSDKTPKDLRYKLSSFGIHVSENHFYTSALATAAFLGKQKPHGTAYVLGDAGIVNALYNEGFTITDIKPDYVVVGETENYNFEKIEKAINLVRGGAKLIGTNCDLVDKSVTGFQPACGTLVAPIVLATGVDAYFLGKPNPLIMRSAMSRLGVQREDTVIMGDRMDTDILSGIESDIDTVLMLSGVTSPSDLTTIAYRPKFILDSIADLTRHFYTTEKN